MFEYIYYTFSIFSTFSALILMFMPFILLVIYILRWTGFIKINLIKYLGVFILATGILVIMQLNERESRKQSYILRDYQDSKVQKEASALDTSTIKSEQGEKPE